MIPPAGHQDLLDRPLIAHFGTVRSDGAPLVNPMWFLWVPDREVIRLTHTKSRNNYRYLQAEPRVAVEITDPDMPYRYLLVRGRVIGEEDDPTGSFYQTLQQRYRGTTSEVRDRHERVVFTIEPTHFRAWGPAAKS